MLNSDSATVHHQIRVLAVRVRVSSNYEMLSYVDICMSIIVFFSHQSSRVFTKPSISASLFSWIFSLDDCLIYFPCFCRQLIIIYELCVKLVCKPFGTRDMTQNNKEQEKFLFE